VVWTDVLALAGQADVASHPWKDFETQLYNDEFNVVAPWSDLKKTYFTLCRFYNAAGFSDLILRARWALEESPNLNQHDHFIFDEYQDFNVAEAHLLARITAEADATLVVGDDHQVLYETLKAGKASLIRAIYAREDVVNAMLPFCGRCDFHITKAAAHYIKQHADRDCIEKIYLPMTELGATKKVELVACATPSTAVDYIRKFIEKHRDAIEQRREDLADGKSKDALLLILSPSKKVDFYHGAKDELFELIRPYQEERKEFSDDYYKILNYYALARYPEDNFGFRKVLHHERVRLVDLLPLLQTCIATGKSFATLDENITRIALGKASTVRDILDSNRNPAEKVVALREHIEIEDPERLCQDLEKSAIDQARVKAIQHQEEEDAELEEIAIRQMAAVELMTVVGSKGLSADHVIIIGFDNVNMRYITRNAFYVAMTRARRSLHIVTALKAGGAAQPHAYLDDLPVENIQFSKYTKTAGQLTVFNGRADFVDYLASLAKMSRRKR
jgi:superfamily I DNA/RNA helicase